MKRLLLSTAAVALLSGATYAADLPVMEAPAPIVEAAPVAQNWTGVYIGLHGGYGWANADGNCEEHAPGGDHPNGYQCNDDTDYSDDFNFEDADFEGAVIGGQIGANFQWNWFVLGVEGDASWSGIDLEDDLFDDDDNNNNNNNDDDDDEDAGIDWLASARLRAGVGLDRVLIYGTGGIGFAGFDADEDFGDNNNNNNNHNNDDDDDDDESEAGWVAGGGVEFMVTDNVTVGAEYLHYEFDDEDDDDDDDHNGNILNDDDDDIGIDDVDVIRGRVNVKFGSLFGGGG